jgi:hypothetical protein
MRGGEGRRRRRKALLGAFGLTALVMVPFAGLRAREANAYPLDASKETGITRLEGFRRAQKVNKVFPRGVELTSAQVRLRLADQPKFRIPPPDPELTRELVSLLGADAGAYGVALLDLSDPKKPRYAAWHADHVFQPGSVGKILTALGFFQALADAFPDVEKRKQVLRETKVVADGFIYKDDHEVPFWTEGQYKVTRRPIEEGDAANSWTFLDWMISSSSNAAAAIVQREAILLNHFGDDYPPSPDELDAYLDRAGSGELSRGVNATLHASVRRNGLDPGRLRQGGFFTKEGKRRAPSPGSYATPRSLLEYVVAMEKGDLVDRFTSLELKRLLYLTDNRIRYAASPALNDAAVYFKSGSLFRCRPEAGYACEKYHGNLWNYMNSVAIVEMPNRPVPLDYIAVVMSNVLRKNSAEEHLDLATLIQNMMAAQHPLPKAG